MAHVIAWPTQIKYYSTQRAPHSYGTYVGPAGKDSAKILDKQIELRDDRSKIGIVLRKILSGKRLILLSARVCLSVVVSFYKAQKLLKTWPQNATPDKITTYERTNESTSCVRDGKHACIKKAQSSIIRLVRLVLEQEENNTSKIKE